MTTADLLAELVSRGVEFQAHGDRLRFRPTERLGPADVDNIRQHKSALLALLRAEGLVFCHPAADPRPLKACDRCGSTDYHDIPVHNGQSRRRDYNRCHRFLGWPQWYGRALPGEENHKELRHED
jgi:hypothetical protein